ncbi:MAG: hypothetical protein WAV40_05150 [Microgenomates group bacterium]
MNPDFARNPDLVAEKLIPKKIFRVPAGFIEQTSRQARGVESFFFNSPHFNLELLELVRNTGFQVVEGGVFERQNPQELGMFLSDAYGGEIQKRTEYVAGLVGLDVPKTYTLEEMLSVNKPILAKAKISARGENKWLLETIEHKVKFVTAYLLAEKIQHPELWENDLKNIFLEVKKGNLEGAWIGEWTRGNLTNYARDFYYQEYCRPDGDYNTSTRVWVDAMGKIHGAALFCSTNKQGQDYRPDDEHMPIESHLVGYVENGTRRNVSLFEAFFTNPKSPFYFRSRNVPSNIPDGGREILLNGEPCKDEESRAILIEQAYDPDHPVLEKDCTDSCSKIGKIYRPVFPIVGVDLLRRSKQLLLEINTKPQFTSAAVGLPEGMSDSQNLLEMIRRVVHAV